MSTVSNKRERDNYKVLSDSTPPQKKQKSLSRLLELTYSTIQAADAVFGADGPYTTILECLTDPAALAVLNRSFRNRANEEGHYCWERCKPRLLLNPIISGYLRKISPGLSGFQVFKELYLQIKKDIQSIHPEAEVPPPLYSVELFEALVGQLQDAALVEAWKWIYRLNPDWHPSNDPTAIRAWLNQDPEFIQSITYLKLRKLQLPILPDEINLFSGLDDLEVTECNLRFLTSLSPLQVAQLIYLDLRENQIDSWEDFPPFPSLVILGLANNQMKCFSGCPAFPWLQTLSLESNQMESFERCPSFPLLKAFYLANNQIESFSGCPLFQDLLWLELDGNQMKSFEGCPPFPMLSALSLSNNQIESFSGCPLFQNLNWLALNKNQIKDFDNCPEFPVLRELQLNRNQIVTFLGCPSFPELKNLELKNNWIGDFTNFPNFPKIEILNLTSNLIPHDDSMFDFVKI